jgi:hypothetical protein
MPDRRCAAAILALSALALVDARRVACAEATGQKFPDIVGAKVRASGPGRFDFDVTVSSPYDTPQRYADAFRVETPDGRVLGERILFHDHQDEQPFTRDLYGVTIAPDIASVVIRGRDRANGWGGKTFEVALPGR